jgi:predicted membrane channel-forming protein YqfA (hemolysin III family)
MNSRRLLSSGLLILLTLWLGWTAIVDFVVVPAVFRNIANFFEAGDLGIYLFTKLNNLEVVIASVVIIVLVLIAKKNKKALPLLVGSVVVFGIALTYFTWLIPKISDLTEFWKLSDAGKSVAIADIQQVHQHYHRMYIVLDTVKMFLLLVMLIIAYVKEEWTA